MPRVNCPSCTETMDYRAKSCRACAKPPRLGTGSDWKLHSTGYLVKCINGKWWYQHRYAMTKHLGRELLSSEHVHHIDHDGTNNALSNLELINAEDHGRCHSHKRRRTSGGQYAHV